MSIYKIIAFILILISLVSSVGGAVYLGFNNRDQTLVSQYQPKIKLEFENLEFATTNEQKQLGYMNRKEICNRCGMLFIFEQSQPLSFWMKNTFVPLKITFIDTNGVVLNSEIGQPQVTNPTVNSVGSAIYVLEVPINSPIDLKPGDQLDMKALLTPISLHID
jgi:uncharacterized protein